MPEYRSKLPAGHHGVWLRQRRERLGLSAERLAELAGVRVGAVRRLESGGMVSLALIQQVSRALDRQDEAAGEIREERRHAA